MAAMVKEMCEVVEVRRVSDRVMAVVLAVEEDMLRLMCRYARQSVGSFEENKAS